jgi:DNA anti-recombination protein RmuC
VQDELATCQQHVQTLETSLRESWRAVETANQKAEQAVASQQEACAEVTAHAEALTTAATKEHERLQDRVWELVRAAPAMWESTLNSMRCTS